MACPQKENGFTSLANELLEAMLKTNWSGQDFKVVLLVVRKTYGFRKTEDFISLSQIQALTGMSKTRSSQVVNRLQLMKILTVTENINGIGKKYKLNKDFESWQTVKENINRYTKTKQTVNVLRKKGVNENINHKRKIVVTKENTKETTYPAWLDLELWNQFKEHRKGFKEKFTNLAEEMSLKKLIKWKEEGYNYKFIIEESIANGWKGLFKPKDKPITTSPLTTTFKCNECREYFPNSEMFGGSGTCKPCYEKREKQRLRIERARE